MVAFFHRLHALFSSTSTSSPTAIRSCHEEATMIPTKSLHKVGALKPSGAVSIIFTRWQSVAGHGCGTPSSRSWATSSMSAFCSAVDAALTTACTATHTSCLRAAASESCALPNEFDRAVWMAKNGPRAHAFSMMLFSSSNV